MDHPTGDNRCAISGADLQERVKLLDDQINAAQAQFDKFLEQIKSEHDARLKDLKAELEAVNHLLGIEHRRLHGAARHPSPKRWQIAEIGAAATALPISLSAS